MLLDFGGYEPQETTMAACEYAVAPDAKALLLALQDAERNHNNQHAGHVCPRRWANNDVRACSGVLYQKVGAGAEKEEVRVG